MGDVFAENQAKANATPVAKWLDALDDTPASCSAITYPGRNYLANGDPGYPDEYCENDAEPGSDYCADHQDDGFPYDDRDEYDEARDLALDRDFD